MKSGEIVAQGEPNQIITESLIQEVYGLNSMIIDDPLTHTPLVLPKPY
jgi:iron complex transport system ATP-binding protein